MVIERKTIEELGRLHDIFATSQQAAINVFVNTSRFLNPKCEFAMLWHSLRMIVVRREDGGRFHSPKIKYKCQFFEKSI